MAETVTLNLENYDRMRDQLQELQEALRIEKEKNDEYLKSNLQLRNEIDMMKSENNHHEIDDVDHVFIELKSERDQDNGEIFINSKLLDCEGSTIHDTAQNNES